MDKIQALSSFWSSFGWPALNEQGNYDEVSMEDLGIEDRYILFEAQTGNYLAELPLTAQLFHRSMSDETVSRKAQEIAEYLGVGGVRIPIDGGYLWIMRGNPFSQPMRDENNPDWRRTILNITAVFLTAI